MSITNEIKRLQGAKSALKDSIKAKGVDVADTDTLDVYADKVGMIQQGGGSGYTGHVDVEGLKAIGWSDDDIATFQNDVWWNEEDDNKWKLSNLWEGAYEIAIGTCSDTALYAIIDNATGFRSKSKLMYVHLRSVKKSTATYMQNFFNGCKVLKKIFGFENLSMTDSGLIVRSMQYMFYGCNSLEYLDLSTFDTSNVADFATTVFNGLSCLTKIDGVIDASSASAQFNLAACTSLMRIQIKNMSNGINASSCALLDRESLLYLINNAKQVSDKTITLGAVNLAKLTEAEKQIAIDKGWTLA